MRKALWAAIVALVLLSGGVARASFVDDNATFSLAISALRGAVGQHARVLRIAGDTNGIEIDAQDARNPNHINRFRYGIVTYMGVPLRRLSGPEPVNPALINPDIEANLFDLDLHARDGRGMRVSENLGPLAPTVDMQRPSHFAAGRLRQDEDLPGAIRSISPRCQSLSPTRLHAHICSVGADVSGTERAKMLNIPQGAGACRASGRGVSRYNWQRPYFD